MKKPKTIQVLFFILQVAVLIAFHFILPLSDGMLVFWGIVFVIIASLLKLRYGNWAIVIAFPISYVLSNLLDTPHPMDGSLPNNLYALWYLIFISFSIVFMLIETLLKMFIYSE